MDSVRAAYNRLSRWYDWLAGAGEARLRRLGLAALQLEPGENVLEVGCGRVCAVALALPGRPSAMVAIYTWFHRRFPDIVDCRPIPAAEWIAEEGLRVRSAFHQSL